MKRINLTVFLIVLSLMLMGLLACQGPANPLPDTPPPPEAQPQTEQQQTEETASEVEPVEETVAESEPVAEAENVASEPTEPASGSQEALAAETPLEQGEPGDPPDLSAAAELLGVAEQELMDALGPPPPDLTAAAATLGISEEELQNALVEAGIGPPADASITETTDTASADAPTTETTETAPAEQGPAGGPPDLAVVAETLGITEQALKDALGPPPPDLAAAAATLGLTEEELQNAMAAARGSGEAPASEGQTDTTTTESTTTPAVTTTTANGYPLVDTNQTSCYGLHQATTCGTALSGQDAQYSGLQPSYVDNGDGTVTDVNTGLMWQKDPGAKTTYSQALANADSFNLAGYDDWRLPTIKELYSLILFSGTDASICTELGTCAATPFIDTNYFDFAYGDTSIERIIDSQFASSNKYVSTTMNGDQTLFGVNFADGRIKGYGLVLHGSEKTFFVLYVRGNPDYGLNNFVDNGNGTILDQATGLMWQQADSGTGMIWGDALTYCENLDMGGYSDWRLPNAKTLQSILDYSRSPDTTGSAAIDPIFAVSSINNEGGSPDYPFYWSSTTHPTINPEGHVMGANAAYLSFGKAMGYMEGSWLDVHGAGAQRSDPKTGDPGEFPTGHGPQGDAIRVYNYARCVRAG